MDKPYVISILHRLKSSSSSQIQEALIKIKSVVITNEKGIKLFKECKGFENLLPYLKKPNERILDLTLSILGNVCLDEQYSLEMGKLNCFGPLVSILKTVSRDSLLGRTSRLLGNLAQVQSNAESLHNYGAVQALVNLIENRDKGTSYATLTMAVRTIRLLWMVVNKREEMLSLNAVYCISVLLTAECELMGVIKSSAATGPKDIVVKKSQEELINGVLKCMGYFTTYTFEHCAKQIQGNGRGYLCLVALMETHEAALKCLMNLCYMETCRPILGNAGLVESLVNILQKDSDVTQWPPGAIRALSQLCREAVNRARVRRSGGLPLVLAAARVDAHALRALLHFAFDDDSFNILIQEGLVDLLVEKLTYYVSTIDYDHDVEECSQKEAADNSNQPDTSKRKRNNELKLMIDTSKEKDMKSEEADDRIRRKILKRSLSNSYRMIKETQKGSSDSDSDSWDPDEMSLSHVVKSPDQGDQMSVLCSEGYSSGFSSEYGGSASSKRARWDWSPESGVSAGECGTSPYRYAPWSPASSGPASPVSVDVSDASDSELSGRYSPVCSEPEEEEGGAPDARAEPDAAQDACNVDTLVIYDDSDDDDPPPEDIGNANIDSNANIPYVVALLFQVSVGGACTTCGNVKTNGPAIKLLTEKECINGLLDYVEKWKRPMGKAAKTLRKVVNNPLCLMSILKHRLPIRLHHMSLNSKHSPLGCKQCQRLVTFTKRLLLNLTLTAESSHCIGEISHHLLKGTSYMKQTLAMMLPHIIKTERALKTLLIDCDALNLLLKLINEDKEDLGFCVSGLSNVAINIRIKDPKVLEKRYKEHSVVLDNTEMVDLNSSDLVTFKLDDFSTVNASKSFLCQCSEVFNAMLMGCFKESNEKCVQLKNVSKPALKYLITLLESGLNEPKCDIKVFPIVNHLETSLEVLLLADRFLFDTLKDLLRSAILQFQLTPKTAHKIYIWSLEEGMGFLCVEAVAYILTGDMTHTERLELFKHILDLEYKNQWLDDIKSILLRQLNK